MHALRPGAVRQVLDDAGRHAAGDPERRDELIAVEPQRRPDAGRRRQRADDGRRVEPGLVDRLRGHEAEAAHELDAGRDAAQRVGAGASEALARGQHRRHDDGARMDRPALEGVVEILAMRGRAVDERRRVQVGAPVVPDQRRGAGLLRGGEHGVHVIRAARRDAQPGIIEDEVAARAGDRVRDRPVLEVDEPIRQPPRHRRGLVLA
jgi:hypothetical protein